MIDKQLRLILILIFCMSSFNAMANRESATTAVSAASAFVLAAQQSEAQRLAPVELKLAKDNLSAAKAFLERRKYKDAEKLAIKAKLDAQLASARVRLRSEELSLAELQESVDRLRSELNRSGY